MSASDVRGIVERLMAWEALVANDEAQTLQEAADEIERLTRELEEARAALRALEGTMYSQTQKMAGLGPVSCDHCEAVFEREITAEGHDPDCVVGRARAIAR